MDHIILGILFLVWGAADVLRLELPGILGKRLKSASAEERRLWQRLLGVLELIVGGGQLLFYFFSDNQTVTSIILAVMNLLPIPGLDGGHALFTLWEIITRRKPSEKFLEVAQYVGLMIILALLVYANGNDIYRFFIK